jgi:hypothetical protein
MSSKWIFIIDTDSYAGNFERDLCAYVTGVVGGCTVGEEFAALYHKEAKKKDLFYDCLEHRCDDNGCARPTECWPTEGWLSVGYDDAVREEDWNQEAADKAYQKANVKIYEGYLRQTEAAEVGKNGWTEESKAKQIARHKKEIEKASKEKAPKSKPHNSVAIFFEKEPTEEMISVMKERAANFAAAKRKIAHDEDLSWDKNFELVIHGFRLEEEVTKSKSRKV